MTFASLTFFIFLVAVWTAYWALRRRLGAQNLLLVFASYLFYGWWDWRFCGLLAASSTMDYLAGRQIDRSQSPATRRAWLVASLLFNLGILGFFKYFNFFADSLAHLGALLGWPVSETVRRIILPVGISFYTFQSLSYTVDVYRRQLRATPRLVDYLAFVAFFPQLVAGPIERASHLLPQVTTPRSFDYDLARQGCRQILGGLFRKMVIADNLAPIVESAYANPAAMSGLQLLGATVAFSFQIYCDFSGYSAIAIGTARLFGFRLMRNFACPYFSQSVAEFWRRWHISLSTWFRDYVYHPLGGSRAGQARRVLNVMLTFTISGLWHGASWNFVLWGGLNGLALVPAAWNGRPTGLRLSDPPGGSRLWPGWRVGGRMARTFAFVCMGWVFFRARTLADAVLILRKITCEIPDLPACRGLVQMVQCAPAGFALPILLASLLAFEWVRRNRPDPPRPHGWRRALGWIGYVAVSYVILHFGTHTRGDFIYFQF